jgi:sugar/nucleoside kinase (ribokinase family)
MKLGFAKLRELYQHTEIFFCNVEEAQRMLSTEEKNVGKLLRLMREEGPKTIVITDGPRGAYAYDGSEAWFMPPYPDPKPPYERTGAGDAFASTLTSALALGKSLDEALMWGPINSMSVVQEVGAQKGLLKRGDLENYLAHAPANYKPQKITE